MRTIINVIIVSIILLTQACRNNEPIKSVNVNQYPQIIDSQHLENWYDSTKWYLYTYYCLDTPDVYAGNGQTQNIVNKPYSSLDLRFDSLTVKNDSFFFYFNFYNDIDKKIINYSNYREWSGTVNGLMFSPKNPDTILCLVRSNSSMPLESISYPKQVYDTTSYKKVKPLQPDVIRFINKNKNTLNSWFLEQAKKRGVLN